MLVLVIEVLIGFHFRSVFEPGLPKLPLLSQHLNLGSLALLLVALALLLTIAPYHQIVAGGELTPAMQRFVTKICEWALLPFSFSLGFDFYTVGAKVLGVPGGLMLGLAATVAALVLWYGIELIARQPHPENPMEKEKTALKDKVRHVLTEARVVIPGTQALLGFQFVIFWTESFEKISHQEQVVHLMSLGLVGISAMLLMVPTAWHRIVEHGEDTERFDVFAGHVVLAAMVPLAAGIAGDIYVVLMKMKGDFFTALLGGSLVFALFCALWFLLPVCCRKRRPADS